MSQIDVVRTNMELPSNMDAARSFLFGALQGFGTAGERAWKRFWRTVINLEPGEMIRVEAVIPRNSKFHRKFFALLTVGFEYWEAGRKHKTYKGRPVTKNFESFREDIIILAGFYEQTFSVRGRMKLRAKSISFAKMEEPEFEALYGAVADVLLEHVLTNYAGRGELDEVVQQVMGFNV